MLMKYCKPASSSQLQVKDVLKSEVGSLRLAIDKFGQESVEIMILALLKDLVSFFNFTRTMDAVQMAQTTSLILKKYQHLTPEDFQICFQNIKSLKYGKMFEGIDGAKIIACIDQYDIESQAEIQTSLQAYVDKRRSEKTEWAPEVSERLLNMFEDKKRQAIADQKPIPKRELTPAELEMQKYFKEFDALYAKVDTGNKSAYRIITFEGKNMDISQYINYRFEHDHPTTENE